MERNRWTTPRSLTVVIAVLIAIASCVTPAERSADVHRWWGGLGPVIPHESFPADCSLCHMGSKWNVLVPNFVFDHEGRTGVPLVGAHTQAQCLRCHNDRGPVASFQAKGCVGCHEDVHQGDLGPRCTSCHNEDTWRAVGQIEMHSRTRFPLFGAHAITACHRCHPGARVGNFQPTDTKCLTCHTQDLLGTTNPPHIPLGFVDNCERCHIPTSWNQAR